MRLGRSVRGGARGEQAHAHGLHARAAPRAGEGVPVQQVHLAAAARRARAHAQPHRAPHQDLVPEPAYEVEEGRGQAEGTRHGSRARLLRHFRRPQRRRVWHARGASFTSAVSHRAGAAGVHLKASEIQNPVCK